MTKQLEKGKTYRFNGKRLEVVEHHTSEYEGFLATVDWLQEDDNKRIWVFYNAGSGSDEIVSFSGLERML